jgi:DNA-binding transcriptional ArsR family regulator
VRTSFEVLAQPIRRSILDRLRERPRLVGELAEELGVTQPLTSKHLRVLREAGLVEVEHEAQWRIYRLRPEAMAEVDAWLSDYRALWLHRMDALHTEVARGRTTRRRSNP